MATKILRPDEWEKLVEFCGKRKIGVPDSDTSFVCVTENDKGEITGFMPVQPAYMAGPLYGGMEMASVLARIDEHFGETFGMYGLSYLVQWKKGNAIQERVLEKPKVGV